MKKLKPKFFIINLYVITIVNLFSEHFDQYYRKENKFRPCTFSGLENLNQLKTIDNHRL